MSPPYPHALVPRARSSRPDGATPRSSPSQLDTITPFDAVPGIEVSISQPLAPPPLTPFVPIGSPLTTPVPANRWWLARSTWNGANVIQQSYRNATPRTSRSGRGSERLRKAEGSRHGY